MTRPAILLAGVPLVLGAISACSWKPSFALPDRRSPSVRAEEARLADLLAADRSGKLLSQPLAGPVHCTVRLLRKTPEADYVYADCEAGDEGLSFPVRVVGTRVSVPDDGDEYAPSLRRLFPADIAAALIADDQRYKP